MLCARDSTCFIAVVSNIENFQKFPFSNKFGLFAEIWIQCKPSATFLVLCLSSLKILWQRVSLDHQ